MKSARPSKRNERVSKLFAIQPYQQQLDPARREYDDQAMGQEQQNHAPLTNQQKPEESVAISAVAGYCDYCGEPLDPRVYFCLACAKPFKSIEKVIPRARPRELMDEERIAKSARHAWPMFWTFFSTIVVLAVLNYFLFDFQVHVLPLTIQTIGLAVVTCFFAVRHWRTLTESLKKVGLLHWQNLAGLAMLAVLLVINYAYHEWIQYLAGDEFRSFSDEVAESGMSASALIVLFVVCPAVTEEIGFRGLLQPWLTVAIRPWKGMVLTAGLFATLHFSVISFPYLFAVGMLLGWVRRTTGSLYPTMALHGLHNYIVIMFLVNL